MGGRAGADELCDEEEQIDGEVSSVDPCGGCGGGAVEEAGRAASWVSAIRDDF